MTVSYSYNGLGDQLSETANGLTTQYTMDLNAGLTQVLDDGTHTYLYGTGRIAKYGAMRGGVFPPVQFWYHWMGGAGNMPNLRNRCLSRLAPRSLASLCYSASP